MDKFLKLFGLARRRDLVRAVETRDVYFRQLEKAANDLKVEEWRRRVDEVTYRVAEAGHVRVIAALMDEIAERSVA